MQTNTDRVAPSAANADEPKVIAPKHCDSTMILAASSFAARRGEAAGNTSAALQ
ncbi:hypothetical protein [Accumulibacter sp.]|uniref:hypothetical protein n=1 Tax=Accumulibacter sp. TaxID=2053492 RepID=UPI002D1FB0D2|nr:hypothetical protein [Accumulibacter sp.]